MIYIKDGFLIIDVSEGKNNYSQRNNEYIHKYGEITEVSGNTMCNVTAICQSLDYNGFIFPKDIYTQPEDNLAKFIMSDARVEEYYKTHAPILYRDYKNKKLTKEGKRAYYTPNEVHCVLAYATNLWLGTNAVTFKENVPIMTIINELIEERSSVISGVFNGLGHIVSLVGTKWDLAKVNMPEEGVKNHLNKALNIILEKEILPQIFLIDDPYGKWNAPEGYRSKMSGNNSELTKEEFIKMIRPNGNPKIKMCHLIKNGAAVI